MILAFCAGPLLATARMAHAQPAAIEGAAPLANAGTPGAAPPEAASTAPRWYGYQNLAVDGLAAGSLAAGL
jgi:hypothetical protein